MLNRFREFLRTVPTRMAGTRISQGEILTNLSTAATFAPSRTVADFYQRNRDRPSTAKPVFMLDDPPAAPKPIPDDDIGLPIG